MIAHELGHNFGRQHAPCGNPSGPDPAYPYLDASVGTWGLDLPALSLKPPATYKDLMSYCNPDWISDYTYLGVLAYRGTAPDVEPSAAAVAAPGRGLLVWGRVVAGNVILEPAFFVDAPARLPTRAGPHRIEGLDAAGLPLFSLGFDGEVVPDLPRGEERHFAFVVPLGPAEEARLARLRLTGHGLTALRGAAAEAGRARPGPCRGSRWSGALEGPPSAGTRRSPWPSSATAAPARWSHSRGAAAPGSRGWDRRSRWS